MGNILSNMIIPSPEDDRIIPLYFRAEGEIELKSNGLTLKKGTKVRFNSYFNGFFYSKYIKYTNVKQVYPVVATDGEVTARLICGNSEREQILQELHISGNNIETVFSGCDIESLPEEGALFVEIEARQDNAAFLNGRYETPQEEYSNVKVAIVICTFKREQYVKRNLKILNDGIWEKDSCSVKDNIDVFVVDNGKTLDITNSEHISVFQNKNYGGSGGFTRGLIEAYRRRDKYTHVLFMDDDITIEPEALVKTVQILKYAKKYDKPLCIGGQMLIEEQPTVQYESGASFSTNIPMAVNSMLDLSMWENVIFNAKEAEVHYNAWWYCCFPVEVVDKIGLPYPFFIKMDDVEYGLRMKPDILLMNGIGVWHASFAGKDSPHLQYYVKRNEMITAAIHGMGAGVIPGIWKMMRTAGKAILLGDPRRVPFIIKGYQDFFKGPEFFKNTDEEQLNGWLMQERTKPAKSRMHSIFTDPFLLLPEIFKLIAGYSEIRKMYLDNASELTTKEFWCKHLQIEALE